jgi:hypothetical protein
MRQRHFVTHLTRACRSRPTCWGRIGCRARARADQQSNQQALAAAKARGINKKGEPLVLGSPKQAKQNKADALARAQALRPHIERCIEAGSNSSSAIAAALNVRGIAALNSGQWFPM